MIKSLCIIIFLVGIAHQQTITPYYILPTQTTQNVNTSYSFLFQTDTEITSYAQVALTFPFEFSPNALTQVTRIRYSTDGVTLLNATWRVNLYTFTIQINKITIGNLTIVIDNVLNPSYYTTSSYFTVQTLFQNVVVTSNTEFGRTPFTPAPIATSGGTFTNQLNTYIEQGSSWAFTFTPSTTYAINSTLRFVFPEGFVSNKIQCNVSGIVDPNMRTRVFPSQNIYDCLNLQQALSGSIKVILSGLVNPNYQMPVSGVKVHILQPNNLIVQEIISSASVVNIQNKPLNTTLTIPNNYRNCSANYIFQINFDTDLNAGDYVQFAFTGNWTLYPNRINVVSGIVNTDMNTARWVSSLNSAGSVTQLLLSNFSVIPKSTQLTFYLPLMTPLNPSTYNLNIYAYRRNGGLAQTYFRTILINQTTGYIREMKLHPMQSPIKLPVNKTGPIQIVLFLRNNLPQTNVLTWGQIIIDITPNIPAPIVGLNGVPKCYFYDNKPAANCTFDSSNASKTVVTIFTPIDFNFQQSQVPLTITTEGFQQPQNQGITIDSLVKRYFFEIQFYSNLRPYPIPQQVIFDQWIPDSIPISSLACSSKVSNVYQNDHLKCTLVTPNQVLNDAGHIHFFRVQFNGNGWSSPTAGNLITPNYPCLMYGTNVSATPYVKCDYVSWTTGPYRSQQTSTGYNYITFYGLSTISGGSTITFQIPKIPRNGNSGYSGTITFSILEDTPGYNSPIVYLYTQTVYPNGNSGGGFINYNWQSPSITLTNSVINKVTSITLNSYAFGVTNPDTVILQVDQSGFPNIGRAYGIACGSHTCSKFDAPVQYFILAPSSNLGSSSTITFPNIATPPYSGNFQFNTRISQGSYTYKKGSFWVTVTPDTIVTKSYNFAPIQTVTTLYPNSNHFYIVTWTTVNPLLSLSGNSYIKIIFNNVFTFGSNYCQLTTTATAYDGRNIFCDLSTGGSQVLIKNLADVPAGATFNLTVQLNSTATTATVSPTVSIYTYYGNGNLVDQALNVPFATTPLSNTNLIVLSNFTVPSFSTSVRAITAGYFGHLLINFQPQDSLTVTNGSRIVLTMANGFYPAGNTAGKPLSCQINGTYFSCDYTLSPFTITLYKTNSSFSFGLNTLNVTTLYQNANGIYYPSTQGRYFNTLEFFNQTNMVSLEKVQQAVDILPPQVSYFNITWANRDQGAYNIFTIQIKNGLNVIPSYNDATNAGRIYIGFPVINKNNAAVFAADLGFNGIIDGSALPCFFQNAAGFVGPTSNKILQCKIKKSLTNNYNTWIEIINFAQIPAGGVLRVFIAKITNPNQQQLDINFVLKINTLAVSTNVESQLYYTNYNMWIDMLGISTLSRNELNSSTPLFQAGALVGDTNQYFNITPYTGYSQFATNDWWIIDLDFQFPLSGNILNCQKPYYQYCIIYPSINWLAVKIGNTTIIPLQPYVSKLPISISRVDTIFKCYTFMNSRWTQTITYTLTAATRWLALRGSISNFNFQVVGSQNKLNVGQKNVQVLISFNVQHIVPIGGTIEIQFPNNSTTVPAIKMHCRSAVTMGSALMGFNTGKPAQNVQGEVGCTVQNTYSWIITGFDQLSAGSQVIIYGSIDFPTVPVNTLGMGYICTYSTQDSNTFTNGRTIDYLNTNFPMLVQNTTWNVDSNLAMLKTAPLRTSYVGDIKFFINLDTTFSCSDFVNGNCGEIYISLYKNSIFGEAGGFGAPPSVLVCTIVNPATLLKYGCKLIYYSNAADYYDFYITTYQSLPANTNLQITLTSLQGSGIEGFSFPTIPGIFKTQLEINYCDGCTNNKVQAEYIEVYGPNWGTLFFNSTVSIPSENNFILVTLVPPSNIATTQQIVIQIPTVGLDNVILFPADLGMGYQPNDKLIFDLYQSTISSMSCNVYPGDSANYQPTKIVCSSFSSTLTSSSTIKFGFWVANPPSTVGMSIPVQVYAYDQQLAKKFIWSIVEAGIRILPVTVTPINDLGNFVSSNPIREIMNTHLSFTTRNTRTMVKNDWYILKFGFDLRQSGNSNGSFNYNSGLGSSGDVIFMRNCQTIMLRVGTNNLDIIAPGATNLIARITSLIYNPSYQLTSTQATIYGYIIYNSLDYCQRVYYRDTFPTLVPNQPSGYAFSITPVFTTNQKGMLDDWQISFRMGNPGTNSSSLVKYISIQFPASTVSDVQLMSRSCIQYITSTIQVAKCVIDINNRVIWITPVVKSTYTDASVLTIETQGLAIKSAVNTQTNLNMFTIRYYTWPNGQSMPSIVLNSDNWCFMKQDSSNIGSTALQINKYTNTYYSQHSYVNVPPQLYVNEWQPADYFIGNGSYSATLSKSPFSFKFIAAASYNSLQGSNNYHTFAVNFGSIYTYPTLNQMSLDLYQYVPVCYLNGFQILSCAISSTTITMQFQQAIANGQTVSVTFSIINPKDQADYGFTLANTNNPTVTFSVYSYNYNNGVTYLVNPEPFHTFYRATSPGATYPSYGIQTISVAYGTQVVGQLNYVQFTLTLTRTDINGFVIEIPVLNQDGTRIYNDATLLNLDSGSAYPCSMGIYTPVSCYYQKGNANGFGSPTRIYVSGFTLGSSTVSFRMLFTNPDITEVFPSFIWKAFGGSFSLPNLMGNELRGYHTIIDAFKVFPTTNYYSTGSSTCYPSQALWQKNTYYDCYHSTSMNANTYTIMVWPLVDPTYGTIGDYTYTNIDNIYDLFYMYTAVNQYNVYLVQKRPSYFNGSIDIYGNPNYMRFGYLRMKHHIVTNYKLYLLGQPWIIVYNIVFDSSWISTNRANNAFNQWSLNNMDTQVKINGYGSWHFLSINAGNIMSTYQGDQYDPSEKVVEVVFSTPNSNMRPYSSLTSTPSECMLESGLVSNDPLNPITCSVDRTNNRIMFYNVFWFTNTYLNFYYAATTNSDSYNHDILVYVWTNVQAFNERNYKIFYSQTGSTWTYQPINYASNTGYSSNRGDPSGNGDTTGQMGYNGMDLSGGNTGNTRILNTGSNNVRTEGYAQIVGLSSTSITVRLYGGITNTNLYQSFRVGFRFYTPRLLPGSCSSVSTWTNRWGWTPFSGNARNPGAISMTCGTGGSGSRRFYVIYRMFFEATYDTWPYQWPSYYPGDYFDFYFTFSSVGGDVSFPNSLWVSASWLWENSVYYYQNCGMCGNTNPCCYDYYWCGGCCYDCCSGCCIYNCRHIKGWDYYTYTGTQGAQYNAPTTNVANGVSIALVSNQFSVQTEFSFYLDTLQSSISSTMNSFTATSNNQLIIEFDANGNTNYNTFFPYTDPSESAAYIECLCVSNNGGFSVSYSTTYTPGNCTRYIISGFKPLISVRYPVSSGWSLRCYFPGFRTPSFSSYSSVDTRISASFYINPMHHFKSQGLPYQHFSKYQTRYATYGLTTQGTINGLYRAEQNGQFWTTYGEVDQSKSYYLNAQIYSAYTNPIIYYSAYYPKPSQSACANGNYLECRTYSTFTNRRYFMIARYNGYTSSMTFSYTALFPDSKDAAGSFYNYYIGWTVGDYSWYYSIYSTSSNSGYLSSATPSYSATVPIYGSYLNSYSSPFVLNINLNGQTLYSNQRTSGPFRGSFIQIQASGFSGIYGCGAYLYSNNKPAFFNNALYCLVQNSNTLKIWSNSDLTFTGQLVVTLSTSSVPSSTTFYFSLYDKYISSSDYGISVYTSTALSNNPTGYSILPPTNILWRRQAYKQLRTDAAPYRITVNNNFEYVSAYNMGATAEDTANSHGLVFSLPTSISGSTKFKCLSRQYAPTKYSLYNEYTMTCSYYGSSQVLVQSIPSHILNPIFYYDFIIYINSGSSTPFITASSSNNYNIEVITYKAYSSGTILYYDVIPYKNYLNIYPITLNGIYILTRQASIVNSLYVDFTIAYATPSAYFIEFVFDNLDLNYFGISNGGTIPCYINGLTAYSGKQNGVTCIGFSDGTNSTSPLTIRVLNFAGFSANKNIKIAFDNFNNPPIQTLFAVPINLVINFNDETNQKVYRSYFPNIYFSDSINLYSTSIGTSSLSANNGYQGASTYMSWSLGWPYSSGNSVWDKLVMKINGGMACCSPFTSLASLSDNYQGYTALWVNPAANTSVYVLANRGAGTSTTFYINNVVNPYPVSYATYQQGLSVTFLWYSVYKTYTRYTLTQPNFSAYTFNTDFTISSSASIIATSKPIRFYSHQYYPLTYEFNWNVASSTYNNRNMSHIILYLTGVRNIQAAWFYFYPGIINPTGSPKFGYSAANGKWFVNITGVQASSFSSTYNWYLRVRLFANNSNSISYTSTMYNYNGQQQFSQTSGSFAPSSAGQFSTSSLYGTPNAWTYQHQRYTKGYYELQRTYLTAASGLTTNKLFFKFSCPYNISQVETFSFISSSNTYPAPNTPNNGLHCIIQKTATTYVAYGVGLYAPCTYSSGTFIVNAPIGGLSSGNEYLLTIIDKQQLTSTFNMPVSPQRVQISLIYNNLLSIAYGDVYTLDFAGYMTTYSVDHAHLISSFYDMLGFNFRPSFALSAASTSSPITESVLSFEIESKYYDECLSISSVFSPSNSPQYNGIYYSHYTNYPVANANTRTMCGMNTQNQNWAPAKLTVTDYGALSTATTYYFRFPLITLPGGTNVPLTYKAKMLYYANGVPYPTIISYFNYQNKDQCSYTSYDYNKWATLSFNNNVVQSTTSITFDYSSYNFGNGAETLVKFRNNFYPGLTSISTLTTLSQGSYNYQYYPNINLCSFIFTGSSGSTISLGTYPTSTDKQDLEILFIHTFSGTTRNKGWFNSGQNNAVYTINRATSWNSTSITKGSNLLGTNSWDLYTVRWSADYLTFPEGSYMILTFQAQVTVLDEYCYSHSGFIQGVNINSTLTCKRYASNQIIINGYAALAASAQLQIQVYMSISDSLGINATAGSNNNFNTYATVDVFSSANNPIVSANTASYTLALSNVRGSPLLSLSGTMNTPYTSGQSFPLYITFQLKTNTLTGGDYLQVDFGNWVLDTATTGQTIFKYQISGNIYWVPVNGTKLTGNMFKIPVYSSAYQMPAGYTITLWVDTFAPTSYYGAKIPSIQWNTFKIYAYKTGGSLVEQNVFRIWTEPYGHPSFAVTPALTYVLAQTLYEFTVTPNISASAGDTILIEFTTNDGLTTSNLFSNTLGASISAPYPGQFDCSEAYGARVISDSVIKCRVYQGDNTANIPTTIAIPITKAISANTLIKFNILNINNPNTLNYPIGVVFKLANPCSTADSNNLCAYYKSVTYLSFTTAPGGMGYGYTGSLSFNPTNVSATNTIHTVTAGYPISVGDWLKLTYYSQIPIPTVCTITSSNAECYSYPTTNVIMIKATVAQASSYTIRLGGMTNPYQNFYGYYTFNTQIWRGGYVINKFYSDYAASTLMYDSNTGTPNFINFTPTLTPDYQLKYGFNNIAKIEITNMLQNKYVKMILLQAPSEIAIDTTYCNATMKTYAGQALPYPYRMVCQVMTTNWIKINLQSDFPAWTSNFTSRSVYVYLRYTISNSQVSYSNYWTSQSYADSSNTNSNYLVAQGTGRFAIVEYQLPYLYVISLFTRSFGQRTCTINQKCMFYGFLLPSTLPATMTISSMTFLLPKEFNYSTAQTFNKCTLQPTTTLLYTFGCSVTRNNSQITIGYTPGGSNYNQGYNLLNLDHSSSSMLFTSPKYPGDHYQMQVNLWSNTNALVQTQMVNITTVYGYYLSVPLISFTIPKDGGAKGLFDLTFTVGTADILPSYINSASNSITSAIEISFANTFDDDLGTGLPAGAEIACLNISGLSFNTMGRIKCQLYPSVSTITYPTIIVTGYDRIYANTTVRIQFANLKTLPTGITDYCSLGVSLSYFSYGGAKGYIYQPVSFVVGPASAPVAPKSINLTFSQLGSNTVGQLTNYSFIGSLGSGFSTITTNDYFVIQFPEYTFQGRFNLNPQALCSLAAGSKCSVFGLASQVYIQPSSSISAAAFNFTLNNILNAAFSIQYLNRTITLFTLVNNKVNALGTAVLLKFTQSSSNVSAIINSIDSIYGGDSGNNYYFQFQLNSYLPETGKISVFFPSIYTSLFTVNSRCYLKLDSQIMVGKQAYCSIINSYQLIIVPGVLLSKTQAYEFVVTNITNPNFKLTQYKFTIATYYSGNVYQPLIISQSQFSAPIISPITVKTCNFALQLSMNNPNLPAAYKMTITCPSTIKSASQLKVYLSWNPSLSNGTCIDQASVLYSKQCNIINEYSGTSKLTFLSIWLRSISAQKPLVITGTITNGNQGTYTLNATIGFNEFVYMSAVSDSFYIGGNAAATAVSSSAGSIITSTGQAISIKSANYPYNRLFSAIYTFALTSPQFVVSTMKIEVPSLITASSTGISCNYNKYQANDDYFNLMLLQNQNLLDCQMKGQTIIITGLTPVLTNLSSNGFLYLAISGLLNPQTSIAQSNFTFTFINTSSTYVQAVLLFSLPLSYPISDAPKDMQIGGITLSDNKYYIVSKYIFTVGTVNGVTLTIPSNSSIGIMIRFPKEYDYIWSQIAVPSSLNVSISGNTYSASNITMSNRYLFAVFPNNSFNSQINFTTFNITFMFRNPNISLDCTVLPVFTLTMFDFKSRSIYAQTLSNNKVCPTFSTYLYSINVTGNTKISAGSSSQFIISLQKPAQNLIITPACTSSAISFSPASIVFSNYSQLNQTFNISAANGLSGSFNITFTKSQGSNYTFYNDIQFLTLNVYVPTSQYSIKVIPFSVRSIGLPIQVSIQLQVGSPTSFALITTNNCSSQFDINPSVIQIPAQSTTIKYNITYKGTTIPKVCSQTFKISSITTNNYYLQNQIVYYSASLSIDRTAVQSPMVLQLTTVPQNSTDVGHTIVSTSSVTTTSQKYIPNVYNLTSSQIGANAASFTATTSYSGTVYYAVVAAGTPTSLVTTDKVYNKQISSGVSYGSSNAILQSSGVNTLAQLQVKGLKTQQNYTIAVYLNSTIGISTVFFKNFTTAKASNGASIKIAMSTPVNVSSYITALSQVLSIVPSRIYILTPTQALATEQSTFQASVMNNRYYIYDTIIAPNSDDDSIAPVDQLTSFNSDSNAKALLLTFIPQFIPSYPSTIRQIFNTVPKIRTQIQIVALTYNSVTFRVSFWEQQFVYAVIIKDDDRQLLSAQVINGLDANNTKVITQHYVNTTSNSDGSVTISFNLLDDSSKYSIFVSAQCPLPYSPRLALSDTNVMVKSIKTPINPNLMKNKNAAVSAISSIDSDMGKKVQQQTTRTSALDKIHNVDKSKKSRQHD